MIFRTEDVYFIDCPFWSRELLVPKAIHKWWFQISPSLIAHRRIPQKNPFPSALWRTSPTKLNTHYNGKKFFIFSKDKWALILGTVLTLSYLTFFLPIFNLLAFLLNSGCSKSDIKTFSHKRYEGILLYCNLIECFSKWS